MLYLRRKLALNSSNRPHGIFLVRWWQLQLPRVNHYRIVAAWTKTALQAKDCFWSKRVLSYGDPKGRSGPGTESAIDCSHLSLL